MTEDSFRSIDEDRAGPLGPCAVLLCGFAAEEAVELAPWLDQAQAPGHRLVFCAEAMLGRTLGEALSREAAGPPLPREKLPRVIILSGMRPTQIRALVGNYGGTGLPRPIFASVTPANLGRRVRDLLVDLLREHAAMNRT